MTCSRRAFLAALGAGLPMFRAWAAESPGRPATKLGVASSSYSIRVRAEKGLSDPLAFLRFCRERGAAGVQLPIGTQDTESARRLHAFLDETGMFLEGSSRTPRDAADVERFAAEVRSARECGATVIRTVMLGGRRYETFDTLDEFHRFVDQSRRSLQLAEPVVRKLGLRLAVENHKDFRFGPQVELVRQISSEYVGVCVDTGNNLALLQDPMETVRALAPWAMSCHLKDMAVEESADGFLLSEVPLGTGELDLKQIVETLRMARPELRFCLEMITRDPLRIPCLTEKYWATCDEIPGRDLAHMLAWVRQHSRDGKLPRISQLPEARQLDIEDRHVRESLRFARENLGL